MLARCRLGGQGLRALGCARSNVREAIGSTPLVHHRVMGTQASDSHSDSALAIPAARVPERSAPTTMLSAMRSLSDPRIAAGCESARSWAAADGLMQRHWVDADAEGTEHSLLGVPAELSLEDDAPVSMELSSTLKKRRVKMNKHKRDKRRKRDQAKRK